MSLTLTVPDEIVEAVSRQSQQSGIAPEQFMLDVLQAQFSSVPAELLTEEPVAVAAPISAEAYSKRLFKSLQEIEERSQFMNPKPDTQNWLREGREGGNVHTPWPVRVARSSLSLTPAQQLAFALRKPANFRRYRPS